jgi:hypothetical protein|tara:strand:- start:35 stop:244 length:210 start_codon:yes stop_codon:yes gene_type:complete
MGKMKLISMLVEKEKALRKAYNRAVEYEKIKFDFEGQTFYTPYAKHVLDYINDYKKQFKNERDNTTRHL